MLPRFGYRSWSGKKRLRAIRWWPIARTGISLIVRRRIFWVFIILGLANFLFFSSMVYWLALWKAELAQRGWTLPPLLQIFQFAGAGTSYRDFISTQSTAVMLLLAFGGSILVGDDFRFHSVAFYLSRPLSKLDYFLGKLGAAAGLSALMTLVPALVLYIEYGVFTESLDYFRESAGVFQAIFLYGCLVSVSVSVLLLGIAALCRRTILIVAVWGGIFVFLPLVGEIFFHLGEELGATVWQARLINFWAILQWISDSFFGVREEAYAGRLPWAILVLAGWMLLSVMVFWRKIRGTEVVR